MWILRYFFLVYINGVIVNVDEWFVLFLLLFVVLNIDDIDCDIFCVMDDVFCFILLYFRIKNL